MTNSADPDRLASEDANLSGSAQFAKTGHVVFSKRRFNQTVCLRGRGHNDFGVDPVGISVGITLSCLHNILRNNGWILTKFSWIYNWDIIMN